MAVDEQGGPMTNGSIHEKRSELESKYVELLEKRIAALEALVPDSSGPTKDSSDANKEGVNGTTKEGVSKPDGEKKDTETKTGDADKPKTAEEKGPDNKIKPCRSVVSVWNEELVRREDVQVNVDGTLLEDKRKEKPIEYAFTYRRVMDSNNEKKLDYSELDIESPGLRKILGENVTHYPSQLFEEKSLNMLSPFQPLVFNWENLEKAITPEEADNDERKQAREHLSSLLQTLRSSEELEQYFKSRDAHLASRTITSEWLWTIFPPKTLLYARSFLGDAQIFEVERIEDTTRDDGKPKGHYISCAAYDWDGARFQRLVYGFEIETFSGPKPINSLRCYPLKFHQNEDGEDDSEAVKKDLIERGREFVNLCTGEARKNGFQCDYDGLVISTSRGSSRLATTGADDDGRSFLSSGDGRTSLNTKTIRIKGKIIVDNYSFLRSGRNTLKSSSIPLGELLSDDSIGYECQCSSCVNSPSRKWRSPRGDPTDEVIQAGGFANSNERLLLCPPKVLGYVLHQKIWCQFRIKDIRVAPYSTHSKLFEDQLELDEKYKTLLKAFINNHQSTQKKKSTSVGNLQLTDFIENKGNGLVILLHDAKVFIPGPPGVGKTLTAETVALFCGRPLLPVSVAEIGMEPDKAEENLYDIFADAGRWEAVLLIDEADVFLENRVNSNDTNRNALVSVLLRVLEYYDGIMILTTNRIKSLDTAVQSRIHLAIQYRDLDKDQKYNIFCTFLDRLDLKHIEDRDFIEKNLKKECKKWAINGRQIRNIVSSADSLARSQKKKLSWDHLELAYDTTADFLECLKDLTRDRREKAEA